MTRAATADAWRTGAAAGYPFGVITPDPAAAGTPLDQDESDTASAGLPC